MTGRLAWGLGGLNEGIQFGGGNGESVVVGRECVGT